MTLISNARMYAVCPEAEAAWQDLIGHIATDADVAFDYLTYAAPQPLEDLWRRPDVGCVQMCGYPIALGIADVVPLAAPIPAAAWANGQAVYRSDLIVREDAPYQDLPDTFDGTLGWTVDHSHSGFNALRHHLLAFRSGDRPRVYRRAVGNLVTARRILDSVLAGDIDIGPLDAYWHMLIAKYRPELTDGIRVLDSTATAPMPAFVTSPSLPLEDVEQLRAAFAAAHKQPWFAPFRQSLLIDGFAPMALRDYDVTLQWQQAALAAGYPEPA